MKNLLFCALLIALLAHCRTNQQQQAVQKHPQVAADVETPAVRARPQDDAADDPAIWIHPTDPSKSVVIGTVKKYGLEVYRLDGTLIHSYKIGNPNNVDIRTGFRLGDGSTTDLVVFSDRFTNELAVYSINPSDCSLTEMPGGRIKTALTEVYGICLYKDLSGAFFVFINGKDGTVEQYQLSADGQKGIQGIRKRTLKLQTQPEGMVADDRAGIVYFGEEDKGIWRVAAAADAQVVPQFVPNSGLSNPNIKFDVEGLAIYPTSDSNGYLIASSQGNNSYAVFERQGNNRYIGSFAIGDFAIDGTSDTDGIELTAIPLSASFPKGLFVAQDGANKDATGKLTGQNFKLVSWEKIEKVIGTFGR